MYSFLPCRSRYVCQLIYALEALKSRVCNLGSGPIEVLNRVSERREATALGATGVSQTCRLS